MEVVLVEDAIAELRALPPDERAAMLNALAKLRAIGDRLDYPHTSRIQGESFRELRPRAGRSPWRAFYQRIGPTLIVLAIGPEAQHDSRGFQRAIAASRVRRDAQVQS